MSFDAGVARIAIVHDWLVVQGGAEKVLDQFFKLWPQADLFSVVDFLDEKGRFVVGGKKAKTSFIQRLPWAKKIYRKYLPLMPIAIEQFDLSQYDIVLSSSHSVAKGVITGPDQLHVCYVYSPIRYAWDLQQQYLTESGLDKGIKSIIARLILHYLRIWDSRTSSGVDFFVSVSSFISRRISKVYGRSSTVIYPPIDVERFSLCLEKEDFYVTASRMVPYKKIHLIADAFSKMPDKKLYIIGDGPDYEKVKSAAGPNVFLLGYQPIDVLVDYLQRARAFIFAAEEDFGIAPLEAQACGTPVIAYGKGGALETVLGAGDAEAGDSPRSEITGVFFHHQTADAICDAVKYFEAMETGISPLTCRRNAERFSADIFRKKMKDFIDEKWQEFQQTSRNINPFSALESAGEGEIEVPQLGSSRRRVK
jgi:glycosyltransferase involved in cell wall biosynthesis